ncbi:TPA: hypothetical protein DIV49_02580 [Candidatus Saccharibacteria bacterium]|nr:hypothetical protein [Candidatus Saccharibacteria bacterium]HRJ91286.1 hypothetical protein [Candidatus Saccharibacteria bacterium]
MREILGSSTEEQELLRPIASWAAKYAEEAVIVFERRHPGDARPREAIEGGREFGGGKKRDKNLRTLAFAAMKSRKDIDTASAHAVQAAILTASVAYTHTDLQTGLQGIRQARHILGPIVYAALAIELASSDATVGDDLVKRAIQDAPPEAGRILTHLPAQPQKAGRVDMLFSTLDTALRIS